jgi:hypothetical protein
VKKIVIALVLTTFSLMVFAQELKVKGEAKSGVYWEQSQDPGKDPVPLVYLHSKDDAGNNPKNHQGRFQLDLDYDNGNNFGMKARIRWQTWSGRDTPELWQYAFGYGNFFDDQMTVSVGKLGASPWGTGGPEMWKELEVGGSGGMRLEVKPGILSGLNVGFVLNTFNQPTEFSANDKDITILHLLQESVLGISYTHDLFHIRFAYRLDSDKDCNRDNLDVAGEEDEFLYRIEEHILDTFLPGLRIWAMGYFQGVRSDDPGYALFQNWLFAEYAPDLFTAQIRFGYDWIPNRSIAYVKPSFYWNFFDKLLSAGASFSYGQDFGEEMYEGSPYLYMEVEPKIQFNFSSSYIALVYNWRREYKHEEPELTAQGFTGDPIKQTQWINLRFCVYF